MHLSSEQRRWYDRIRKEWLAVMQPFPPSGRAEFVDWPLPVPSTATVTAQLFANRVDGFRSLDTKGKIIGEIGTQRGNFADVILRHCEPAELHLFDLEFETLRKFRPYITADSKTQLHVGDSAHSLKAIADAYFDILYIDGDHSLDGVGRDTEQAIKKIKYNGLLVFNDYTPWSILECLEYGVIQNVNRLLATKEWRIRYFALESLMYADIAIQRNVHLS